MDAERERIRLLEKTTKFIDSVVDKLLHDEDEDSSTQRGFIDEIVDKIKARIPVKAKRNNNTKSKD